MKNAGIGGSFQIGRVQLHALVTQVRIENRGQRNTDRPLDGGENFRLTVADEIDAGIWTTTFAGKRWTQLTVANVYALSKSTQLYVDAIAEQASAGANAVTLGIGASSSNRQAVILKGVHHLF
jgi:predicted porin